MPGLLADIFRYRSFIVTSTARQIQGQYQGSLFGVAWLFLGPLALLTVHTVIFSSLFKNRLAGVDSAFSYSIYLCAGLLPWLYFSDSVSRLTGTFVAQAGLIKKAQFPRICLPLIAMGVSSFNFVVIAGLFLAFLLISGNWPGAVLLAAMPALSVQVLLSLGLGVLLGVVNVYFRDVGHLVGIVFQFLFWLTPIVYPLNMLPPWAQTVIGLNPMTVLVEHYQSVILYARIPSAQAFQGLAWTGLLAMLCIFLGYKIHRDLGGEMADEL